MNLMQILLAEDNAGDILLVKQALKEHNIGHELHVVRDGAEALQFVARMGQRAEMPCPDIVLLDLNLPKVDGPEVLSELRKHPECAGTPVIVISSSDTEKDRARMSELGVTRYFRKPSSLEQFLLLGAVVKEVAGTAAL